LGQAFELCATSVATVYPDCIPHRDSIQRKRFMASFKPWAIKLQWKFTGEVIATQQYSF
jgi:hypothetical protein